jgi:hypothetical protein
MREVARGQSEATYVKRVSRDDPQIPDRRPAIDDPGNTRCAQRIILEVHGPERRDEGIANGHPSPQLPADDVGVRTVRYDDAVADEHEAGVGDVRIGGVIRLAIIGTDDDGIVQPARFTSGKGSAGNAVECRDLPRFVAPDGNDSANVHEGGSDHAVCGEGVDLMVSLLSPPALQVQAAARVNRTAVRNPAQQAYRGA